MTVSVAVTELRTTVRRAALPSAVPITDRIAIAPLPIISCCCCGSPRPPAASSLRAAMDYSFREQLDGLDNALHSGGVFGLGGLGSHRQDDEQQQLDDIVDRFSADEERYHYEDEDNLPAALPLTEDGSRLNEDFSIESFQQELESLTRSLENENLEELLSEAQHMLLTSSLQQPHQQPAARREEQEEDARLPPPFSSTTTTAAVGRPHETAAAYTTPDSSFLVFGSDSNNSASNRKKVVPPATPEPPTPVKTPARRRRPTPPPTPEVYAAHHLFRHGDHHHRHHHDENEQDYKSTSSSSWDDDRRRSKTESNNDASSTTDHWKLLVQRMSESLQLQEDRIRELELENEELRRRSRENSEDDDENDENDFAATSRREVSFSSPGTQFVAELARIMEDLPVEHYGPLSRIMDKYFRRQQQQRRRDWDD